MDLEQMKTNHAKTVEAATQFFQAYCEALGAAKVYAVMIAEAEEDSQAEEVLNGNKEEPKK